MAATVLASPFKHSSIGKDVIIMPAVASAGLVPTRAEINAGTNIKYHIDKDNGLSGFELTPNSVTASDLGSGTGYPLNDGDTYGQASFSCHQDRRGSTYDVRSVFTEGTTYYALICDTTDTAALQGDVFAITIRAISKNRSGVSMLMVPVDINLAARSVTIPA